MRSSTILVTFAALFSACSATPATPGTSGTPERASATPEPTASTEPLASPSSTDDTPSPAPAAGWMMAASFDSAPGTSYVTDVAAWNGGFIAIGSAWDSAAHVGRETPAMWASADGETWEEHPVDLGTDDASLTGIAPRADGQLLLIGRVPGLGVTSDQSTPRTAAWLSEDAVTWRAAELPMSAVVDSFDHGPMGYALTSEGEIWFSPDGIEWTMTYEGAAGVVAGAEGFVAVLIPDAAGSGSVVASSDGQSWFESDQIAATLFDVAPIGGDWVATGYVDDPLGMGIWHSPNGLEWTQVLDVNDLTAPDGPKTGRGLEYDSISGASLTGGAGHAFVTLTNNHCCAQMPWNFGVWASSDGMSWELAVEGDAFVGSVVSSTDATVLAGHLRRGEDAAFWMNGSP